jgi:hypothetical protein
MSLADTSFDLADLCDQTVRVITALRNGSGWSETPGQTAIINHQIMSLGDTADNLRTAGVAATLESANSALSAINDATTQAKAAVATLKEVTQVITLAGSLLSLAASAASGDISGIAKGAQAVITEIGAL